MFILDIGDFFNALYPIIIFIIFAISIFARITKKVKDANNQKPINEDYNFFDINKPSEEQSNQQEYSVQKNIKVKQKPTEYKSYKKEEETESIVVDNTVFDNDLEEPTYESDSFYNLYHKTKTKESPLKRFEKYSYIKQAVIMSEILGKPKGFEE